jgi:transcriptional antiterminator NusG
MLSVIPKRKIPEKRNGKYHCVLKKLFPGYILLNADLNIEKYHVIKCIPELIKILGNGTYYSPINENEISVLLKLTNYDGIIDYSKIYVENSIVYVKDGPLLGFEGLIKKIDMHTNRAKIQINFMGEPRLVDVGLEMFCKE